MAKTSLTSNEVAFTMGNNITTGSSHSIKCTKSGNNYLITIQFEIPTEIPVPGSEPIKNGNVIEGAIDPLPPGTNYWCVGKDVELFKANPSVFNCYYDGTDLNVSLNFKVGGEKGNHG